MPLVNITMLVGRTDSQKKALTTLMTQAFETATGTKPEHVQVIITEVERSHWAVGGERFSDRQQS